jgi:cytochrome bd-type quinol oxidase subunit 2
VAIFLGALIVAAIYTASPNAPSRASFTFFSFPLVTAFAWIPLGFASFILAIIALARREPGKGWAIALVVVTALTLPTLWTFWPYLVTGLPLGS